MSIESILILIGIPSGLAIFLFFKYLFVEVDDGSDDSNLIRCQGCKGKISRNATSCPKCGEPLKRSNSGTKVLAVLILYALVWVVFDFSVRSVVQEESRQYMTNVMEEWKKGCDEICIRTGIPTYDPQLFRITKHEVRHSILLWKFTAISYMYEDFPIETSITVIPPSRIEMEVNKANFMAYGLNIGIDSFLESLFPNREY